MNPEIAAKLDTHPCFNKGACKDYARIHLPVAPKCNMSCKYCDRAAGDCVNESRPGVSSAVLSPRQALAYLEAMCERMPVSVAGIAGPGDPMANPAETIETMRLARKRFPGILLCLSTNGLALPEHLDEILDVGVSHVTVTCNAVDPGIGAGIYSWMRSGPHRYRGEEAAAILLEKQEEGVRKLAEAGTIVKINTVVVPGYNDSHVGEIARTVETWGAAIMNPMPMIPIPGAAFGNLEEPDAGDMLAVRAAVAAEMDVMTHCRRCRADAAGLLGEKNAPEAEELLKAASYLPVRDGADRLRVAVTSREGMLINSHLGESAEALVYEKTDEGYAFLEKRPLARAGGGASRWDSIAETLGDCSHLLTASLGAPPREALESAGVECLELEGVIELALETLADNRDLGFMFKRIRKPCDGAGGGCAG